MEQTKPNIRLIDNFWSNPDELFHELRDSIAWDTKMAARQTASFGEPYNYSQMKYAACPLHPLLLPVALELKELLKIEFNNCLLNLYPSGDSTMGFHSDDTSNLQNNTGVAIVSLGCERGITYRSKSHSDLQHTFQLPSGSMLYMDSKVQEAWMHGIKKQNETGPRISLTWRDFKQIPPKHTSGNCD